MSKVVTLEQLENQTRRVAAMLIKKTDTADTKSYVREIRKIDDGVEFVDGNGNVVYKIPVMKET